MMYNWHLSKEVNKRKRSTVLNHCLSLMFMQIINGSGVVSRSPGNEQ